MTTRVMVVVCSSGMSFPFCLAVTILIISDALTACIGLRADILVPNVLSLMGVGTISS